MPARTVSEMQEAIREAMEHGRRCDRWVIAAHTFDEVISSGMLTQDIFDQERRMFWGVPVEIGDPGEGRRVRLVCA